MSEGRGHLREEEEEGPTRLLSALPGGKSRTGKLWEERERDSPKLHFTKDSQKS